MSFRSEINQELIVDSVTYRIAEHPVAPGMPYGQEGRQAIVYQLVTQDGKAQALKVFKPRYRLPALVGQADKIAPLAQLPGLGVCRRTVLSAWRHKDLLRQYPDLTYAVLMPWIEGPTWMEIILEKLDLSPEQSLVLARSLAEILATLEEHGLAHCDLSGPNVILPALTQTQLAIDTWQPTIALVDVEQLYGPGLDQPELLLGGSSGYAHKTAPQGSWGSTADRFAGAVMLGEMLGWCDERVREAAWGENYFDPQEVQREKSERYRLLSGIVRATWGAGVAGLLERAWRSETLADCATFGEWLVTLPEEVPDVRVPHVVSPPEPTQVEATVESTLRVLIDLGRQFEEQGNLTSALQTYRQAQALASAESGLAEELTLIVQDVEAKQAEVIIPEPESSVEEEIAEVIVSAPQPTIEEIAATIAEPQPLEKAEVEPVALAPQSALEEELALIEQDEEGGQEELLAPGLELLVEEDAEGEIVAPDTGPPEEEIKAAEIAPLPPVDEEIDLDRLFDDGLAAYEQEGWGKAQELLAEIVRRQPDYARDGRKASSLLVEAGKQLSPPRRRVPSWVWALGGLAALAVVAVVVGTGGTVLWTMLSGGKPQPVVDPTSTRRPTATVAEVEATDKSQPTKTLCPTVTLACTPTPSGDPLLYDSFDDPAFEGAYDRTLWAFSGENFFHVRQSDGSLIFSNSTAPNSGGSDLRLRRPQQWSLRQLQLFEARLKISSDHSGGYAFVKIQIMSDNIAGHGWWTQCRLDVSGFICDVATYNGEGINFEYISNSVATSSDTWYTVRMEADPSTANLRFYLDDALVGSYTPDDANTLISATNFQPQVGVWNDADETYATRYVDDVRIGEVGR